MDWHFKRTTSHREPIVTNPARYEDMGLVDSRVRARTQPRWPLHQDGAHGCDDRDRNGFNRWYRCPLNCPWGPQGGAIQTLESYDAQIRSLVEKQDLVARAAAERSTRPRSA